MHEESKGLKSNKFWDVRKFVECQVFIWRPFLEVKLQRAYFRSKVFAPEITRSLVATSCRILLSVNILDRLQHFLAASKHPMLDDYNPKTSTWTYLVWSLEHDTFEDVWRCMSQTRISDVLVIHSDPFSRNLHLPRCCCLACCLASSASMKLRRSGSKWSLAAFTEPSSSSMSALPSTTRNETWDLNMKMRKPMTSNEKQKMALESSSLEFLNASQTPFRDKALKWMRQLQQPSAVWIRHSPSSGLLSLASLALYSRTLSSCHDLPQWPLSSCSIGKGRAACRRGKEGSMEWWSHRRKRWKMRGYPQNASTLTPCRHHERFGNGTRKICMAALCKRYTPEFKSFTCISLRLLVT